MANINWQNKKQQKSKRIKNRPKGMKFDDWQNDDWDVDEFDSINKISKSSKKNRHSTSKEDNF
jgi:ligand-binding sensor protein